MNTAMISFLCIKRFLVGDFFIVLSFFVTFLYIPYFSDHKAHQNYSKFLGKLRFTLYSHTLYEWLHSLSLHGLI